MLFYILMFIYRLTGLSTVYLHGHVYLLIDWSCTSCGWKTSAQFIQCRAETCDLILIVFPQEDLAAIWPTYENKPEHSDQHISRPILCADTANIDDHTGLEAGTSEKDLHLGHCLAYVYLLV